jgi:DNA repair exonuclease SbcCD ATPase subunit
MGESPTIQGSESTRPPDSVPAQDSAQGSKQIKSTTGTGVQWPLDRVSQEDLNQKKVQIEAFQQNKVDAEGKVNKLKAQITNIKNSCLSILQRTAITAVVAAGSLTTGLVFGVIAFVAVSYFLYQKNRSKQAQIEILQQLIKSQSELSNANDELVVAWSNLLDMEVKVTGQNEIITEQGQTVKKQLEQLTEQATKISTLEQNNAKLEKNLQAVKQAREDAVKQVQEITATAKTLKESLEAAQTKVQDFETEANRLASANAEQAAELRQHAEAMKAFVDGQQEMVQKLQGVLGENESHLNAMMGRTEECEGNVCEKLEAIKRYVGNNFADVKKNLDTAAAALEKMTGGTGGNALDPKIITQTQEEVTKAITESVVRLGTMQEHIITSLTAAQTALSDYKKEMETKVAAANKAFKDCETKLLRLNFQISQEKNKIYDQVSALERQKEQAEKHLQDIQKNGTGDQKSGWLGFGQTLLENAQAEAGKIQQELDDLQKPLKKLQEQVAEAQERVQEARAASNAIKAENEMIASSCEALKAQNAKLVESNDKLFEYIKNTKENVQAAGESIQSTEKSVQAAVESFDKAPKNVDAAATNASNNSSRWSMLGAIGAGGAAAATSALGGGALAIGGAAAAGVLAPMALACAAAYAGKTAFRVLLKRTIGVSQ